MAHVFISYAEEDSASADQIVLAVERSGFRCWMAPRDIAPGADYGDSLAEALEAADAVVFLISQHSVPSTFCRAELEIARSSRVPIMPVRLDDTPLTGGLKIFLSGRQEIRLGVDDGWVERVCRGLSLFAVMPDELITPEPAEASPAPTDASSTQRLGLADTVATRATSTWKDDALCRDVDPDLFYPVGMVIPENFDHIGAAKAVCGICPVVGDCGAYALVTRQDSGVWGGMDTNERRRELLRLGVDPGFPPAPEGTA